MIGEKVVCIKCQKELPVFEQFIQLVFIVTKDKILYLNIDLAIILINELLDKNPCHLSASEILLMRTDIVTNIFKKYYPNLDHRGFVNLEVCSECYKIYAKAYPLI